MSKRNRPPDANPELRIEYVPLSKVVHWDRNPKRHAVEQLAASIRRYGFRDAPIYDATLGALVAGNGRTRVLAIMRDAGGLPPRGIAVIAGGEWAVPVQMGIDAPSRRLAEAFAIDHNNLTLTGGDLTLYDVAGIWNPSYLDVLTDLRVNGDALPVTVDADDLDALLGPMLPATPVIPTQRSPAAGNSRDSLTVEVRNVEHHRTVLRTIAQLIAARGWDAEVVR